MEIQDWKNTEPWGEDQRDFGEEVVEDGKYALKHAGEKLVEEGKEGYEKDLKTLMLAMIKIDPIGKYGENKIEGAEDFYNDELGEEYQGILKEARQ